MENTTTTTTTPNTNSISELTPKNWQGWKGKIVQVKKGFSLHYGKKSKGTFATIQEAVAFSYSL